MKLKAIETVDFRSSEKTTYEGLCMLKPRLRRMNANEVVLLRSKKGDQLIFVWAWVKLDGDRVLRSARLRLEKKRPWNPLMLANYAGEVGIHLDNIKTFEQHLAHLGDSVGKAFGLT